MYQKMRLMISGSPIIIGIYFLLSSLTNITSSNAAEKWPTVDGVINEVSASGMLSPYRKHSFISYDYEVYGTRYTGNKISFGNSTVAGFHKKQVVDVYYNPLKHNESVLVVGVRSEEFFTILLGCGLVLVGRQLWKRLE